MSAQMWVFPNEGGAIVVGLVNKGKARKQGSEGDPGQGFEMNQGSATLIRGYKTLMIIWVL
jgi:hypothetical protein